VGLNSLHTHLGALLTEVFVWQQDKQDHETEPVKPSSLLFVLLWLFATINRTGVMAHKDSSFSIGLSKVHPLVLINYDCFCFSAIFSWQLFSWTWCESSTLYTHRQIWKGSAMAIKWYCNLHRDIDHKLIWFVETEKYLGSSIPDQTHTWEMYGLIQLLKVFSPSGCGNIWS